MASRARPWVAAPQAQREGTGIASRHSGRFYSVVFRILLIFLRTRRTSYEASASAARSSNANTYTYSKGAPRRSAFLHMLLDLCPPATRWHGTHEPGARLRFRSGVRCQDTFSQRRLRACGHTRSRRLRCRQLWARTAPWRGAQPRSSGHARGGFSGVLTGAPRPPAHSVARWCLVIAQGVGVRGRVGGKERGEESTHRMHAGWGSLRGAPRGTHTQAVAREHEAAARRRGATCPVGTASRLPSSSTSTASSGRQCAPPVSDRCEIFAVKNF